MKSSVKVALALIAQSVIGTVIGVALALPYQFGGVGDPARVSEEFMSKGTAVSGPPVFLVVLIVAILVATQRGVAGRIGSAFLALLAVPSLIATLGETFGSGAFSGPTQIFVIVWSLVGAAMAVAMFVFGAREALRTR